MTVLRLLRLRARSRGRLRAARDVRSRDGRAGHGRAAARA